MAGALASGYCTGMFTIGLTVLAILVSQCVPTARPVPAPQLVAAPYVATGIYDTGQVVGWTLRASAGRTLSPGAYTYTVRRNGAEVVSTGTFRFAAGEARVQSSLSEPGMLTVEIRPPTGVTDFGDQSTGGANRMLLAAAVAPTAIQPSSPRPADFDAFWATKIAQLRKIPENAVLSPRESGREGVELSMIRLDHVNGAHVWGHIAKPTRSGKFPALLILQWASAPYPLQKQWVTDRAAEGWLALNIEPHDVPPDMPAAYYEALPTLIKRYHTIGATNRDESHFLQMYLADVRSVDYLASRPDWDGRTLVVMGTSMGGQQSLSVAGLHPKVTTVIVNEPAGADVLGPLHGRASGYPNWNTADPRVVETAPYFDTVNFASRITATCVVSMGFIDDIAPPVGIWAAFNQIRGPKEAVPMIDSHHNHLATAEQQRPYTSRSAEWLNALVAGRPAPLKTP